MAEDTWQDPFEDQDPHGKRTKGMSTSMKVVLGLLLASGFLLLVCCGGFAWLGSRFANSLTEDPVEIAKIQEEISVVQLPDDLPPAFGMSINLGVMNMQMAGYGNEPPGDQPPAVGKAPETEPDEKREIGEILFLMQMMVQGQSDEQMRDQFRQQAQQQQGGEAVQIEESDTRTFTIDGTECEFMFAKGVSNESEQAVRQVSGMFPGRNGTAFLFYMVSEEQWDEERIVDIIQSLKK